MEPPEASIIQRNTGPEVIIQRLLPDRLVWRHFRG